MTIILFLVECFVNVKFKKVAGKCQIVKCIRKNLPTKM